MEASLSQLLSKNWYIAPETKSLILKKARNKDYSPEKIERLKTIVQNMNDIQAQLIAKIVEKNPLFFAEFDHELQAEAFEKIKSMEGPEHEQEISSVEAELEDFLKDA